MIHPEDLEEAMRRDPNLQVLNVWNVYSNPG